MTATRRDVLRSLLASSFAGSLPAKLLASQLPPSPTGQPDFTPVRRRIQQAISDGKATGVAVAVVHRGSIAWEEGFGWTNRDAGVKVNPHTPFSLASITKPFTATTLMTLVAEGRLSLDQPCKRYLGKSPIVGTNGNAELATVRLLGAHASGLPTMFGSFYKDEEKFSRTPAELLRAYGRLAYPPGTCYEYSNIGFAALSAIASNLTGKDLGTLMTQRVLRPLGLHDSFFDTDTSRLQAAALRYDPAGHPIPFYTTTTPASGELYASAHDLARFAMFNMKVPFDGSRRIFDDHWLDELHKPVFVGPSGVAFTFGWCRAHLPSGRTVLLKNGGQGGVATVVFMIPSEQLACLVLTNRSDARSLAHSVCNEILPLYLPEWQEPEEDAGPKPTPFLASPNLIGLWEGALLNGGATMRSRLAITSSTAATLALDDSPAQRITGLQSEGTSFTGVSTGIIDSPDARRANANTLRLKLLPHEGKLVGRILATSGDPNIKNVMLPYVLTLERAGER